MSSVGSVGRAYWTAKKSGLGNRLNYLMGISYFEWLGIRDLAARAVVINIYICSRARPVASTALTRTKLHPLGGCFSICMKWIRPREELQAGPDWSLKENPARLPYSARPGWEAPGALVSQCCFSCVSTCVSYCWWFYDLLMPIMHIYVADCLYVHDASINASGRSWEFRDLHNSPY